MDKFSVSCYNLYIKIKRGIFMKIIIIVIALFGYVYSILLNIVKLRSANNPTPENVADIYDAETYQKWKRYSAEHCRLSIISNIIAGIVTLILLAFNAYAVFAELFPSGMFWQLFAVVLLETAVSFVVDVPISYVATMGIEQKYGFNRSTLKTFVIDKIRSLIIGLVLSLFLALVIAFCHRWLGNYMSILCVAVLVLFSLLMTFLFPIFSRMGNKFVPLEDGELRDRLMELLTSHGYKVRAIEVMDASRRTTKQNAYFTGLGKMKTIVLFDNLLNAMTPDEICAVFAHELGHGLHKDTTKLQILNMLNFVLIAAAAWLFTAVGGFHTVFGFEAVNYGFAYILIGIAMNLADPLIGILVNAFSRKFEFAADRQAVREGYGAAMIPALKKLARDNFSDLSPSRLYVILEYSHPPIDQRIGAIEKAMKELEAEE